VEKHSTFTFYLLLEIFMTFINWDQAGMCRGNALIARIVVHTKM